MCHIIKSQSIVHIFQFVNSTNTKCSATDGEMKSNFRFCANIIIIISLFIWLHKYLSIRWRPLQFNSIFFSHFACAHSSSFHFNLIKNESRWTIRRPFYEQKQNQNHRATYLICARTHTHTPKRSSRSSCTRREEERQSIPIGLNCLCHC